MNPPGLKKGKPVTFKRPNSTMHTIYMAIRDGNNSEQRILVVTRLRVGQVKSGILNLLRTEMIHKVKDGGKIRYYLGKAPEVTTYKSPATNFIFNPHQS